MQYVAESKYLLVPQPESLCDITIQFILLAEEQDGKKMCAH